MADRRTVDPTSLVRDGDRLKAYRPIDAEARHALLDQALAAFGRGLFFETHEILEPAWMGTADPAERAAFQGLIKLAAAYVHAARGNATGMRKSLVGARERLARAAEGARDETNASAVAALAIDLDGVVASVDVRLAALPGPNAGAVGAGRAADGPATVDGRLGEWANDLVGPGAALIVSVPPPVIRRTGR